MTRPVGDHLAVFTSRDGPVHQRALEGPHPIHTFGGHQFGVNMLIAPTRTHRHDTLVPHGARVEVVHVPNFCLQIHMANINFRRPMDLIFDHGDRGETDGAIR